MSLPARRYAADTSVPVSRSRGEIDELLRAWGCIGVQWTDNYEFRFCTLRFGWQWKGASYVARFRICLPPDKEISAHRKLAPTKAQLEDDRNARWRSLHRVLLLKLKADLNAVADGLVTGPEVFLPYLEGADGSTVAEFAVPRIAGLLQGGPAGLLPDRGGS